MPDDLGKNHGRLTDLFDQPSSPEEWMDHALSEEQVRHFREKGYLHGVPLLNDEQVSALADQLEEMVDPSHEGREFFYEYHSNESGNPDGVLFMPWERGGSGPLFTTSSGPRPFSWRRTS